MTHSHLIIVRYLLKLKFLPTKRISHKVNSLPTMSAKSA